jgi:hypothetical protein
MKTNLRALAVMAGLALGLAVTGCSGDAGDMSDDDVDASEEALTSAGDNAFGLGTDAPTAVASPNFKTLQSKWRDKDWSLRTARTVFYVGLNGKPMDTAPLHAWVNAVAAAGLEPMVGVSVLTRFEEPHLAPVKRPEFRARFQTLLHEFPEVRYWGVVNEPDLELTGSATQRADEAVDYFTDGYKVLRKCKQQQICASKVSLVAGEFSYQGGNPAKSEAFWNRYGKAMLKAYKDKDVRVFPKVWAFHPYTDVSGANTKGTDRFDAFLADLEKDAKLGKNSLRAWLTETGTILHLGDRCSTSAGDLNKHPNAQLEGARTTFKINNPGRVDRIYWWQYKQVAGHPWDSAMVDANDVPRPAFCGLTKQAVGACKGENAATQCK